MGSDCVHSSPFSGSGNPVSAVWVSIQCSILLVKELPCNLCDHVQVEAQYTIPCVSGYHVPINNRVM